VFCFDYRIATTTRGKLFNEYPQKDNSNLIEDSKELEDELLNALIIYSQKKENQNQPTLDYIIKLRQKPE